MCAFCQAILASEHYNQDGELCPDCTRFLIGAESETCYHCFMRKAELDHECPVCAKGDYRCTQ